MFNSRTTDVASILCAQSLVRHSIQNTALNSAFLYLASSQWRHSRSTRDLLLFPATPTGLSIYV